MHDLESYIRSPVRVLTVREFMGEDYEKGEDFVPHSKNQPLREAPPREGQQGEGQHTNR